MIYFARAVGAARSGNAVRARGDVDQLTALKDTMKDAYWAEQIEVQRRAAAAWTARAEGKAEEGFALMRSSVELEASTEKHNITPGPIVTARELLGDMLLEAGQPGPAGQAYGASPRGPTNLDELWARQDMGCVFMCGYPWALRRDRPALLAAPVPSPPRYGGRAAYVSDFIVRADGPHRTLEDTFGGVLAYSTEHSHSGYNAPRHHLLKHVSRARPALYRAVLGPYVRQRPLIDLVVKGEADVASIDGYALDL